MSNLIGRNPIIINKTLTTANTWYKVNTAVLGIRKWFMKAKESTDNSFDYDFTSAHSTIMTNSGSGVAFDGCELPIVYCRSSTAGTIIELIYWQ